MEETYGFPYFLIHRGDLHKILLDRARDLGIEIRTNAFVSTVKEEVPMIILGDGSTYTADLIIGADGEWRLRLQTCQCSDLIQELSHGFVIALLPVEKSRFDQIRIVPTEHSSLDT